MAILSGKRLGPYEILSAIGAGGMGEVYRAKDTRLGRIVAVKILPDQHAARPHLRERFEREARTIATLNHPHICVLHDIGQQDGSDFLVMEYLEGETLAERLKKGPLPLDQVLQYAIEISDALDKAHRKGITHRDLKPGNIMLTKSGTKLLDFGLAKLNQESSPAVSLSQRPTAEGGMTAEGTILGTLQYMAPEQVEGKTNEIDARTDIFAFGAVVYEMATGKKAFEGKTSASVMAKILEVDPPSMVSLQPMTPPALDRVVRKCLAKGPEERWQTAKDLTDGLKWIAESGMPSSSVSALAARKNRLKTSLSVVATAIAFMMLGLAVWNLKPAPGPRPVSRTVIALSQGERLAGLEQPAVAISQDGTQLAYVASDSTGTQRLYLRAMDSLQARPVVGTEGASGPFFSPDGQWIGFFAGGGLKKVSISGGPTLTVTLIGASARGASWGPDDTIVVSPGATGQGLSQGRASGGKFQPLTALKEGQVSHRWPHFLPGGKAVLFTISTVGNPDDWQIAAQRLDTAEGKILVRGGTDGKYDPTGHLVYYRAGRMMAVPFDADRLEVTGTPVPVLEGVTASNQSSGAGQYSFSSLGSLVYVPGSTQGQSDLMLAWVDRKGVAQPLPAPPRPYGNPFLSPDGRRAAVTIEGDIWIYDLIRNTLSRLTFEGRNVIPKWTPDGKRVAYSSTRNGTQSIFWKLADGSGPEEPLFTGPELLWPLSFTPDGRSLLFNQNDPKTATDLWVLPLEGDREARKPRAFLQTPFSEVTGTFSPDGRWVAYLSNESGQYEVYVRPFPGPGGKWQISNGGGIGPTWSSKGNELFYRAGSRTEKMMAVEVQTQPTFSAGTPRLLFEAPRAAVLVLGGTGADYSVAPDGQRFLMIRDREQQQTAATQINVVLNWFEELKQKVPTGKK